MGRWWGICFLHWLNYILSFESFWQLFIKWRHQPPFITKRNGYWASVWSVYSISKYMCQYIIDICVFLLFISHLFFKSMCCVLIPRSRSDEKGREKKKSSISNIFFFYLLCYIFYCLIYSFVMFVYKIKQFELLQYIN